MKSELKKLYANIDNRYKNKLRIIMANLEEPCIILDLFELKSLINPDKFDFPNVEVGEIALENS